MFNKIKLFIVGLSQAQANLFTTVHHSVQKIKIFNHYPVPIAIGIIQDRPGSSRDKFCKKACPENIPVCLAIKAYLERMHFLKEHLSPYKYSWINEATFTGEASRRLFNRYNGNQLLFVLNLYASLIEGFTIKMGLNIEDRLMNQLPVDAKSEISVLNWLKQAPPLPVSNAY